MSSGKKTVLPFQGFSIYKNPNSGQGGKFLLSQHLRGGSKTIRSSRPTYIISLRLPGLCKILSHRKGRETGEAAQWLVLAAHSKDLLLVPSPHIGQLTTASNPSSRSSGVLFWPPWAPVLMWHVLFFSARHLFSYSSSEA